jgi:hypothetical protein
MSVNGFATNGEANGEAHAAGGLRTCPTRVAPGPPVISHLITVGTCQRRQREFFHKCWTCAHSNRLALRAAGAARASG